MSNFQKHLIAKIYKKGWLYKHFVLIGTTFPTFLRFWDNLSIDFNISPPFYPQNNSFLKGISRFVTHYCSFYTLTVLHLKSKMLTSNSFGIICTCLCPDARGFYFDIPLNYRIFANV